jgi:hypothetical protein
MIYFLLLLSSLALWATPSKFDLSYGVQGRTLPALGAELYADSGYNQLLWGKKENPKDILYGLIRPSLGASTSAVVNSAKAEIEIFPISFIGFAVGRQYQNSNFEFPFFDCDAVTCKGEYQRNYIESKMVLGFKGWILLGNYKVDTLRSPNSTVPMADWRNVIVGEPGEEVQIDKKLLFGKVFSNKMLGVLIESTKFEGSGELKESFAGIYQVRHKDTNYMMGVGGFHTDQQPMGLQFYFRIHHIALPSLKLF